MFLLHPEREVVLVVAVEADEGKDHVQQGVGHVPATEPARLPLPPTPDGVGPGVRLVETRDGAVNPDRELVEEIPFPLLESVSILRDRRFGVDQRLGREAQGTRGGAEDAVDLLAVNHLRLEHDLRKEEHEVVALGASEIADVLDLHLLVREQEPVARKDAFQYLWIVPALLNQDSHLPPRPWVPP